MMESNSPATPRRAALVFIFVTVVLDVLALGIIIPVLPKLVVDFLEGDTARAAGIYGLFGTVWALMQFFFSPVIGGLSDRYGRRPVVLLSNFGLGLDYILMALAPTVGWLFVGRVISGITGASFTTAGAYIADVTPPEKRAAGFGMLSAAFGLGFVLGPAVGGVLGGINPRLPFWGAAGFTLVNATYGLFVLPESLPRERRTNFSWKRANPVGALKLLRSHPELLGLAAVTSLFYLAHEVLPSTFVLYANYRYGWGERTVGLTLAGAGVCAMVVQGGFVQPVVTRFGERKAVLAGLMFGVAGFAIYGLATTGAVFLVGVPVMALWGFFGPAAQGMMTGHVSPFEQGQLQGALNGLRGISGLIGPSLFTLTFAAFIGSQRDWQLPGAPFLLASLLLAVALLLAWRITRPS
ncbi:MAG: TCR/Tet family MFS transporter [Planctomycetia bacterium]|nr:TCR/Tet family MFS transporter [Planctomycetia bacterium]